MIDEGEKVSVEVKNATLDLIEVVAKQLQNVKEELGATKISGFRS